MKRIDNWQCPICGHRLYDEVFGDNFVTEVLTSSEGHVFETKEAAVNMGYECHGCTVMFGDPASFNRTAIKNETQHPIQGDDRTGTT